VRDVPYDPAGRQPVAVTASVRSFAQRRAASPGARPEPGDLRGSVRQDRPGTLVVIALDTSGSMGARERVEAATGAVLGLLTDAYQRRDRLAVVTFDGEGARVALAPTSSVEVARTRLAALHTGGTTPLAAGIHTALDVARRQPGADARGHAVLVVVTDGRATAATAATGTPDPLAAALDAAQAVRAAGVPALVLDAETGTPRLGLAARLAEAMGAPCRPLATLPTALHDLTTPGA
jgi:magnesium chelatase subunit D